MCLKQVISPLSTPAPILRIDATCQDPVRPSGDTDKEEGDIDQVKVCVCVFDLSRC